MCWACNPVCGRCKPPKQKAVTCPVCKQITFFSREQALDGTSHACPRCGADVTAQLRVQPVACKNSGKTCAWPCGQHDTVPEGGPIDCPYNTPVA